MGCPDQLAVKQDFYDLESRLLSNLATKDQANEILSRLQRVETGTDTTIPGAIANIVESLASIIRDPIVAAIEANESVLNNAIDSIENAIINSIKATENVLNNAIDSAENAVLSSIQATENVLNNAIDSTENVFLSSIKATENVLNNAIDLLENNFRTLISGVVSIINDIKSILTAGFDSLNNLIEASRQVLLAAIEATREIALDTLATVREIAPYLENIILNSQSFLANLFADYFLTLQALINALPEAFPDFNVEFDAGRILQAIQGIDGKLGSYPLACGDNPPITGTGTVAGALEAIICGGGTGIDSTGDDAGTDDELSNLSTRQLLEKMADAIGVNEFPGEVPKTLLNSGDNPEESGVETIPNLVQFILWIVKQMDALIGEFPVKIKVEDSSLLEEGNQTLEIELNNIAEAMAELFAQGSISNTTEAAILSSSIRTGNEAVQGRIAAIRAFEVARANAEFLGYNFREKDKKLQVGFDFSNPSNIPKLLSNRKYHYKHFQFDGDDYLPTFLRNFMFAAHIIKGAFYRTDTNDIAALRDELIDGVQDPDSLWDDFVNDVNNPESFYNEGQATTPKIRDLREE